MISFSAYHTSKFLFSSLFNIISTTLLIFFIWWALVLYFPFIFFFFSNYVYLVVAVLGLHCCVDFPLVAVSRGLFSGSDVQASHRGGFSCAQHPWLWHPGLAPRYAGSSWVRNWTHVFCRRILYHWATREVLLSCHGFLRPLSIFITANLKSLSSESSMFFFVPYLFLKTSHLHQYGGNWKPEDPRSGFLAAASAHWPLRL